MNQFSENVMWGKEKKRVLDWTFEIIINCASLVVQWLRICFSSIEFIFVC